MSGRDGANLGKKTEISAKKGKVWLVGAGPGDPGLVTLRAREVMERADVIVYDRLVGPGVAEFFPASAECVYVGKRAGSHSVVQAEIEKILLREASLGKRVVRVKGGDPFLFGRGGEEALRLAAAGIDVEIVPGVTSAISVPAYAGIPVTHRGLSCGVHIVTAHRKDENDMLDYGLLSKTNDTVVILMGAGRIGEITQGLIDAGKDAGTPAAVIENGTTARMRSARGNLSDIAQISAESGIGAPAAIVVGPVAKLASKLDWRAGAPLAGTRVWLTESKKRTSAQSGPTVAFLLRDAGAEVAHLPCITTEPIPAALPPDVFLAEPSRDVWFVFSSRVGVEEFFSLLRSERRDIRSFEGVRIAAVGPATADALEQRGLLVDYVPVIHDGWNMALGLSELGLEKGGRVVLFRCTGEPPKWRGILERTGADVLQVDLYRTIPTPSPVLENVEPGDIAVFKSASAVEVFAGAIACSTARLRAVCIGKPSAQAASKYGFIVTATPRTDDRAIFKAVMNMASPPNK